MTAKSRKSQIDRVFPPTNMIWGTQLLTLALVVHMWFDMMGELETGRTLAVLLIFAGALLFISPLLHAAYRIIRGGGELA